MTTIEKTCPMCGVTCSMSMTEELLKSLEEYLSTDRLIQNCFPTLNPMEREFIKTGYCPDCQKIIFESDYDSDIISILND